MRPVHDAVWHSEQVHAVNEWSGSRGFGIETVHWSWFLGYMFLHGAMSVEVFFLIFCVSVGYIRWKDCFHKVRAQGSRGHLFLEELSIWGLLSRWTPHHGSLLGAKISLCQLGFAVAEYFYIISSNILLERVARHVQCGAGEKEAI